MPMNGELNMDSGDAQGPIQRVSFRDIDRVYEEKNADFLNCMVSDSDPFLRLNCALRDNDRKKAKILAERIPPETRYSVQDVSDTIVNKSRMRVAYLAAYGDPEKSPDFLNLCGLTAVQGHDVLLFSHANLAEKISDRVSFFLAHPDASLSGIVPKVDAVIAENWSLAAEAARIDAPLKFFFADHSLARYPFLEQQKRNAMRKAYGLPMRILSFSQMLAVLARRFFERDAAVLTLPVSFRALHGIKKDPSGALRLLIAANGSDAPEYLDALGTIGYLKANGIEFNVTTILADESGENGNDFAVKEHILSSKAQMIELLMNSDAYLDLSSDDFLSCQIVNALACGCAVILPKGSGAFPGLSDGENCAFYDPIKPPGLANALQKIAGEQDFRRMLGSNGRQEAQKHTENALVKKLRGELEAKALQAIRL